LLWCFRPGPARSFAGYGGAQKKPRKRGVLKFRQASLSAKKLAAASDGKKSADFSFSRRVESRPSVPFLLRGDVACKAAALATYSHRRRNRVCRLLKFRINAAII